MDEVTKSKIVVADICNTLFDSNTTFDFILYCVKNGNLAKKRIAYSFLLERKSPFFWILGGVGKLIKRDLHKKVGVSFFKGYSESIVEKWAEEFYRDFLDGRKIQSTHRIIELFSNKDILLVSSTIYPIARVISRNLAINKFIATRLELVNHRYTGRILDEISGRKLEAIKGEYKRTELQFEAVISDNYSDKELFKYARIGYAVCYNDWQEDFWKSEIPGINLLRINVKKG